MLHKDPTLVAPKTFELIQSLQSMPELTGFYLVGGTALSLQLGHRNSIDIDLFTQEEFDDQYIIDSISKKRVFLEQFRRHNTIIGFIDKIKVDFICHPYPFVKEPITEDGITYLSREDIAAMKLNAIAGSGQRIKDFIDIYFLLESLSINDMLECYATKYPNSNSLIAYKAVSYFNDIDPKIDPPQMKQPLSLDTIKMRIKDAVLHPFKTF